MENSEQKTRGFKTKTIRKTIERKLSDWARNVEDKEVKEIILNRTIVTGGSIASMLQGQLPNDYDCYFENVDDAKKVADYYVRKYLAEKQHINNKVMAFDVREHHNGVKVFIQSAGVAGEEIDLNSYQYFETMGQDAVESYLGKIKEKEYKNGKYKPLFFTENSITLANGIQVILRFVGSPEEIHRNFDFVHCTNYFHDKKLTLVPAAMEAILTKELKYIGSLYPVCSIFRIRKFLKRGWTITAGEIFKICYDVSLLDMNDSKVLHEQLTGVDYAYFHEVISILKKNSDRELDRTYLFEIVERVFDEIDHKDDYEGVEE